MEDRIPLLELRDRPPHPAWASMRSPFVWNNPYLWLTATTLVWGVSWVAAKWLTYELGPLTASTLRIVIAAVVLVLLMAQRERSHFKLPPKELPVMLFLALTGAAFPNLLFFWGMKYTTAMNGSLIMAGSPVATAILSALILREAISGKQVLGIALTVIGVVHIISGGTLARLLSLSFNLGDLLILVSLFSLAINAVYSKPVLDRLSPLTVTTYGSIFGSVISLPALIPEWSPTPFQAMTARGWFSLGFLSVMASSLAALGWVVAIKHLGPTRTSVFANVIPIWTIIAAVFLLGEQLLVSHIIGGLLVLAGVYLASARGRNNQAVVTE